MSQRCALIALLGAPNAGKSTLVNRVVGAKVAIVTPKAQTTRSPVRGIVNVEKSQLIFLDVPGVFEPKKGFDEAMVSAAWKAADEADVVLYLLDAAKPKGDVAIIERLRQEGKKAVLVFTKIDTVSRESLLPKAQKMNEEGVFSDIFFISAETGECVQDLLSHLAKRAPESPWLYPEEEDVTSDVTMRELAAEITREKLFMMLNQELPYSLNVETESWEEEEKRVVIRQCVTVERESHKKIVIGAKGEGIKRIGMSARRELEKMLERKVHLVLFVRVRPDWKRDPETLRNLKLS